MRCPFLALVMLGALVGVPALGQEYPNRPIRVVVPYPPGGSTDVVARQIGQSLQEALHQPVVIENRGGASGMIGAEVVARAAPDGYTLLMTASGPHAINVSLFPTVPYDPVRSFTPIVLTAVYPLLMVTPADRQPRTVAEFIAHARANPGRVNYCSIGPGTPSHLAGELFRSMAGIEMTHVPYRGSGPAVTDTVAGVCDVLFDSALSSGPHARQGRLRALAVSTAQRVASWPELPTVAEAGLPGYEAYTWTALVAPAGVTGEVVARLNAEVNAILQSAHFREQLEAQGAVPGGGTPQELAAFTEREVRKWAEVIRAGDIKAE